MPSRLKRCLGASTFLTRCRLCSRMGRSRCRATSADVAGLAVEVLLELFNHVDLSDSSVWYALVPVSSETCLSPAQIWPPESPPECPGPISILMQAAWQEALNKADHNGTNGICVHVSGGWSDRFHGSAYLTPGNLIKTVCDCRPGIEALNPQTLNTYLGFSAEDQRQAASSGHAEDHVHCFWIVCPCSFLHCNRPFHRKKEQAAYHHHTIGKVSTFMALSSI